MYSGIQVCKFSIEREVVAVGRMSVQGVRSRKAKDCCINEIHTTTHITFMQYVSSSVYRFRVPHNKLVQILSWDINDLISFDKPAGVLTHPNKTVTANSKRKAVEHCLIDAAYSEEKEAYSCTLDSIENSTCSKSKSTKKIWLLNRLDSATSGIVLGSGNEKVAQAVKRMFKQRQVTKCYYAVVFGNVLQKHKNTVIWEDNMNITKGENNVRASGGSFNKNTSGKSGHGRDLDKVAVTNMTPVHFNPHFNTTLLELRPLTGFTHQLRYQCANRGFPIVGDKVYGDFAANKHFSAQWTAARAAPKATSDTAIISNPLDQDNDKYSSKVGKRLFLHSHSIDLTYSLPSSDNGSGIIEHRFTSVSPLPSEFNL